MRNTNRSRILLVGGIFVFLFVSAVGRLFYLQIWQGAYYAKTAKNQQAVAITVSAERGNIYLSSLGSLKDGEAKNILAPLALTKTWYNVWLSPKEIGNIDKEAMAAKLAEILELDRGLALERISKAGDPYEPLKDKVDKKTILDLAGLGYQGIYWKAFYDRNYPLGGFAAQVTGFVSQDYENGKSDGSKTGKYGLEGYYNSELEGQAGYVAGFRKALGSLILPLSRVTKPKKGEDIYLTIDYNIQLALEKEIKKATEKFNADSASAIILDPKTGAILAMAAWPDFDPNKYNEVKNPALFLNPNVQLVFEPGSIFKPITMAAALDINVVSPDLKYNDTGEVNVSGFTIRNSTLKAWGEQTMAQVLEKSLNTGVIFVLRRMPQGVWREYVKNFGFAEKTGVTLSGEAKGNIQNLTSGVEIDWVSSAFGQGVSVTPLAMANAIGAIANGGELLKPYLVSKIVDNDRITFEGGKIVKRRVIKQATSQTLTKMLVGVVDNGSGRQAQIPGYTVAGKTGTAQVASPGLGGYTDKTIHTFVGYSPAFDPAFLMLVRLDNPKGAQFSETTTAPVFRNVGEFILHYMGVKPDKPLQK